MLWIILDFPCGSAGKEYTCNAGDLGLAFWVFGFGFLAFWVFWERLPTPVFWPGEFYGLYSPWGRIESDTTERLSLHFTLDYQYIYSVIQIAPCLVTGNTTLFNC